MGPEDWDAVQSMVSNLGGAQALLLPVGSFAPLLPTGVFDFAGNAAEWCEEEGEGYAVGGCAALPADPYAQREPPPECCGLRVMEDL